MTKKESLMTGSPSDMFKEIDVYHDEGEGQHAYDALKRIYDRSADQKKNINVLWRLARACNQIASQLSSSNPKRKILLVEGQKHAQDAIKLNGENFNAIKWAAVTTGELTGLLSTKEKIQQGFVFKGYLDKALSIDPNEFTLLHMRGRFSYSVASLSWIERTIATALFATPPKATFQEAIADFLEVERVKPGEWIENLLFLAKSYIGINDKSSALKYLKIAAEIAPEDESDKEMLSEVKELISKCK